MSREDLPFLIILSILCLAVGLAAFMAFASMPGGLPYEIPG